MRAIRLRTLIVLLVGCLINNCFAKRTIGLDIAQTKQAEEYNTAPKPVAVIQQQQRRQNKFTQTEAHLQIASVRKELAGENSNRYIPYMNIFADCLAKEVENADTHYAFYHTTDNEWRLAQDVYTQLYAAFNPSTPKDFAFLRFEDISGPKAKDFLVNELRQHGLVDDNGEVRALLLSVNISLFGNTGFPSECTWDYFLKTREHVQPGRETYDQMMDKFGVSRKYVEELLSLMKLLETKEKTLLQIFVPKNRVDEIGYLAWATGIPAHDEVVNWVRGSVEKKVYPKYKKDKETGKVYAGELWAMWDLAEKFQKQQEKDPMFKNLMESVKAGDYSLDKYLKIYCNNPWEIKGINYAQARLIFSPDVLLNPQSGIKIYRYTSMAKQQNSEYSKRLKDIIDKIVATKGAQ